jgi:hypothetical protein
LINALDETSPWHSFLARNISRDYNFLLKFSLKIILHFLSVGSPVISQIPFPEYSPKVSPKDSLEFSPVTSPMFSFLFPKKDSSKVSQITLPRISL